MQLVLEGQRDISVATGSEGEGYIKQEDWRGEGMLKCSICKALSASERDLMGPQEEDSDAALPTLSPLQPRSREPGCK